MPIPAYAYQFLPAIEEEMQHVVSQIRQSAIPGEVNQQSGLWDFLHHMLAYHMGWTEEKNALGKRVRPILLLLVTGASGSDWHKSLPAAAAVELLHNFSLIHDDIEDNSPLRRGRPTLWKNWGIPQATNTGDVLFTLANLALLRLAETAGIDITLEAARIFQQTNLALTQGQYLDIAYEHERELPLDAYWPMVMGKTASLISACAELGALIGSVSERKRLDYQQFGFYLGLAFQVQDDILGIWGNAALTGKSTDSDLASGKKSLPVLYGLEQNGAFAQRWRQGPVEGAEIDALADQLKAEGAYTHAIEISQNLTKDALEALDRAKPHGEAGQALKELSRSLLSRDI